MSLSATAATALDEEPVQGAPPAPGYVMSRYADGRVGARYRDLKWDWTPYEPHGRPLSLNFVFWDSVDVPRPARELLLSEMQFIMYLLIRKRQGPTLSAETLGNYVELLRSMARLCEQSALRIRDILTDKEHLLAYAMGRPTKTLETLASLLSNLGGIGGEALGYQVLGEQMKVVLRGLVQQYFLPARQHPPIPTRIYSKIISGLIQELTEFEQVSEEYLSLADQCVRDPWLGRSVYLSAQRAKRRDMAATGPCTGREIRVPELLARHGLTSYFEAKSLNPSVQGVSNGLKRIQTLARLTVQVFTGMRVEEVSSLKYACLQVSLRHGKEHFVLVGSTTKLNHGRAKAARWVTNQEAARAVRIA